MELKPLTVTLDDRYQYATTEIFALSKEDLDHWQKNCENLWATAG
jgi:hypothetical protein